MIEVRRLTRDDWLTWKEMRLRALLGAPDAYGETYANAVAGDDAYWQRWWAEDGTPRVTVMVFRDGAPAGQAGGILLRDENRPILVAMWVDPEHRGTGTAGALIEEIVDWGREQGFDRMTLGVTQGNDGARKLYLRHGFEPTGRFEALHSNPTLSIEWMVRALEPVQDL
ncbi:MAG: GNAT family N-acetyltransferase [Catenulispora sp.]|nr:GNAT family N-acetyltransferase [Catenulispora sp.]